MHTFVACKAKLDGMLTYVEQLADGHLEGARPDDVGRDIGSFPRTLAQANQSYYI